MQSQAPQEGAPAAAPTPSQDATSQTGTQAAPELIPGLDATGPAMVAVVAALFVFFAVFYLLSRWRIGGATGRAAPARRGRASAEDSVFQPAGEGAEITFDDEVPADEFDAPPAPQPRRALFGGTRREPQPRMEQEPALEEAISLTDAPVVEPAAAPARRSGAFSGLFGRRKGPEPAPVEAADSDETSIEIIREPRPLAAPAREIYAAPEQEFEVEREPEPEPAPRWRRDLEDEAREAEARAAEARRAAAEEDLRREMARRAAEREAEFERRKAAAALEQRRLELEARERAFAAREADAAQELERTRAEFAREQDSRNAARAALIDAAEPPEARQRDAEGLARIEQIIAGHREAVNASLRALLERIDTIAAAPQDVRALRDDILSLKRSLNERATGPSAPLMQLSDIMRDALPHDAYEMRASLPNGRRADCLVRLPDPPGPLPIDARFPIEAFAALRAAAPSDPRAENEFRRAALRHIAEVAERLIRPGDAGAAAMLFLPSESMSAELHARFPDVVEDSYRARVWIVSPTSLMASLTALKAVLRTVGATRPGASDRLLDEIETLRRRVAALETGGVRSRAESASPGPAIVEPPPEAVAAPEPDLWEDRREAEGEAGRQPFPLR